MLLLVDRLLIDAKWANPMLLLVDRLLMRFWHFESVLERRALEPWCVYVSYMSGFLPLSPFYYSCTCIYQPSINEQ